MIRIWKFLSVSGIFPVFLAFGCGLKKTLDKPDYTLPGGEVLSGVEGKALKSSSNQAVCTDFKMRGGEPLGEKGSTSAGILLRQKSKNLSPNFCSGVLLCPGVVATAGHCLESLGDELESWKFSTFNGSHFSDQELKLIEPPSGWKTLLPGSANRLKFDVGKDFILLLRLDEASKASLKTADKVQLAAEDELSCGEGRVEGYGKISDVNYTYSKSQAFLSYVSNTLNFLEFKSTEAQGSAMVCSGDSGGPIWHESGTLLGILHGTNFHSDEKGYEKLDSEKSCSQANRAFYMPVSKYKDKMEKFMAQYCD